MSVRISALAGAILLTCSAGAFATASNKELEARANELDARLAAVERANQTLVQLQQQIESLRQELRSLRGQVDEVRHDLDGLRQQQRDLYTDLDRRLLLIENGAAAGVPQGTQPIDAGRRDAASGAAGTSQPGPAAPSEDDIRAADETTLYSDSFAALKAGRYDEAARGFQLYLTKYPSGPRADYATYWLGESQYVQKDYGTALKSFQKLLAAFPDSRKAPDGLLKVGYCQYELKAFRNARATLQKVVATYPGTDAERLAEQRLVQMDSEGR
ncbi:MAG TPA: tol-pal system protein YbgF [Steroidobacteraceae bacterium]|nr:tol-pal system protein YbgF [Steroidobacteraceae bacterium]